MVSQGAGKLQIKDWKRGMEAAGLRPSFHKRILKEGTPGPGRPSYMAPYYNYAMGRSHLWFIFLE